MAVLNKVQIIGALGRDPELRKTPSGSSVCDFSVATTERFKGNDGQMKEDTEWHNIVAWNKTADAAAKYLKKGSRVYVEGKLRTRSWEDNGVRKYRTEIIAKEFQFMDSKKDSQNNTGGGNYQGGSSGGGGDYDPDAMPF